MFAKLTPLLLSLAASAAFAAPTEFPAPSKAPLAGTKSQPAPSAATKFPPSDTSLAATKPGNKLKAGTWKTAVSMETVGMAASKQDLNTTSCITAENNSAAAHLLGAISKAKQCKTQETAGANGAAKVSMTCEFENSKVSAQGDYTLAGDKLDGTVTFLIKQADVETRTRVAVSATFAGAACAPAAPAKSATPAVKSR